MGLNEEVRDTLRRHGFTPQDIETVEAFEAAVTPKRRKKIQPEPLDFGDWQ